MEFEKRILVTGGAGFIGSHMVRRLLKRYPNYLIVNLDKLTYAGNLENLSDVQDFSNYTFEKVDIQDLQVLKEVFERHQITDVIHLAAESHVDRSIHGPLEFVYTNIIGTVNLLEAARAVWGAPYENHVFHHVSTDEVYGSLGETGYFTETTAYDPRSPYSASKASSDHIVKAYFHTYGFPIKLSNCSNNYGSHHFPEKLIPLMINNILQEKPLPVYGNGSNIRDWLWVEDHASAIDLIFHKGKITKLGKEVGYSRELIRFVKDRAGHDHRYAIDATKLRDELGWTPSVTFQEGLDKTVDWYLSNAKWIEDVTSGTYKEYYTKYYQ
ncbi:MAG: dTDP-glucose 4,6-dehydratase [Flavobacteriia bacterium]|nr:dTDP-glucose 4,6-dehydratase [Flavobacteriia bacterium]